MSIEFDRMTASVATLGTKVDEIAAFIDNLPDSGEGATNAQLTVFADAIDAAVTELSDAMIVDPPVEEPVEETPVEEPVEEPAAETQAEKDAREAAEAEVKRLADEADAKRLADEAANTANATKAPTFNP